MTLKDRESLINKGKCKIILRFWGRLECLPYQVKKTCKKYIITEIGKIFYKDIAQYEFVEEETH
jgi:hypothetical protein